MNVYLKKEAFFEFEEFIVIMYWSGLISESDYKVKRRFLFSLLESSSPLRELFEDSESGDNDCIDVDDEDSDRMNNNNNDEAIVKRSRRRYKRIADEENIIRKLGIRHA